jgi:tRNA A-37 threonylcarbamoyl transferase component Bud32
VPSSVAQFVILIRLILSHYLNFYDSVKEYTALLRDYIDGKTLEESGIPLDSKRIQEQLRVTINSFHERGISGLDISADNIIISPDRGRGTLIDFNAAVFREECKRADYFEGLKKEDYSMLKQSFS